MPVTAVTRARHQRRRKVCSSARRHHPNPTAVPSLLRLAVLLLPVSLPLHYESFSSPSPFPLRQHFSPRNPYPSPLQPPTLLGPSLPFTLSFPVTSSLLVFPYLFRFRPFPLSRRLFLSFLVSSFPFSLFSSYLYRSFVPIIFHLFPLSFIFCSSSAPRRKTLNALGNTHVINTLRALAEKKTFTLIPLRPLPLSAIYIKQ